MKKISTLVFVLIFCINYNSNSQTIEKYFSLTNNIERIDTIQIKNNCKYKNLQFSFLNEKDSTNILSNKNIKNSSIRILIRKDSNNLYFSHYSPNFLKNSIQLISFPNLNFNVENNSTMNISILRNIGKTNPYFLKTKIYFKVID